MSSINPVSSNQNMQQLQLAQNPPQLQLTEEQLQIQKGIKQYFAPMAQQIQTLTNQVQLLQVQNQILFQQQNQVLAEINNIRDCKIFKALDLLNKNNLVFFDLPKAAKYYCLISKKTSKSLLKKIPLISLVAGITFGLARFTVAFKKYQIDGDKKRAYEEITKGFLEMGSGVAGMFPGIGTGASAGIDGIICAWDAIDFTIDYHDREGAIQFNALNFN